MENYYIQTNIRIMNEMTKVAVNASSIEESAKSLAENGGVAFLKGIEYHKTNVVFLNNAAIGLSKLSAHPTLAQILVKKGAISVILTSMQLNPTRKGLLAGYVSALSKLLHNVPTTSDILSELNGYEIIRNLASKV